MKKLMLNFHPSTQEFNMNKHTFLTEISHRLSFAITRLALLAVFCLAQGAWADDAETIASYINSTAGPSLSASFGSSSVTVTGTLGAAPSGANFLTLNIDAGVTVTWQATLQGSPSSTYSLINISGGSGTFYVSGGSIENTGTGRAITNNSTGTVNIYNGTVKTGSGMTIYNASTGLINISGSSRITSASTDNYTIYLASSGTATTDRLVIDGGVVENTANSGTAIYNYSTGAISISGGTVSATIGNAIYNYSSGTINISGSARITSACNKYIMSTNNGTINLSSGRLNISGGTVEHTGTSNGGAIHNNGNTVTVSGGTIRAANGVGIWNYGTLNVSGGTIENIASNAAIENDRTANISGGTIRNTASGNAIINTTTASILNISDGTISASGSSKAAVYGSSGKITVTGGAISGPYSYAIYDESSATLTLGNSPNITGRIYSYPDKFSVIASNPDTLFNPGSRIYTIDFPEAQYAVSKIAVNYGGSFLSNFTLYNPDWTLNIAGQHLAIANSAKISFDSNSPIINEDFEGSTHSFTLVNGSQTNQWAVGTATASGGTKSAYISNNSGTSNAYTITSTSAVHIYRSVTFPASGAYNLKFDWKGVGESNCDDLNVRLVDSYSSITAGYTPEGTSLGTFRGYSSWQQASVNIPATNSGTTKLLVFTWRNDGSAGTQPPIAVDNILLTVTPASIGILPGSTLKATQKPSTSSFTRAGYTNDGEWYMRTGTSPNYIYTPFVFDESGTGTAVNSSITLYLKWTPIAYEITYNLNDGIVSQDNPESYDVETETFTLTNPAKENYIFTGWTGSNGTTPQTTVSIPKGSDGDKSYIANWVLIYTVAYDANGGDVTTESGTTGIDRKLESLPTPTRTGYTFNGWYTAETGGSQVTENTVFYEDATIYARWTLNTYTVTFNANSGTVSPTSGTTGEGWTLASLPTPTRTGYTFGGWYTAATGGTEVTESRVYSENTTIYARWTLITYTVTFNANSGTVSPTSGTTGNSWTLASLPTPTRTGYTFNGWHTAATGGTQVTTSTTFSANTTIYARWTLKTYTVTFNANSGTVSPTYGTTGEGWTLASLPTPTRTGYTFGGWYTAATGGTAVTESEVYSENTTIYAQWTSITYTVTFADHDGNQLEQQTVNHGSAATAPTAPAVDGYTFSGWDKAFNNVTSDLTVAAVYVIKTYIVTFMDYDGTPLKTVTVNHGEAAAAPPNPERDGYIFTGWDAEFDNVTSRLTVTAEYIINYTIETYIVIFASWNGIMLKSETVEHGSSATAPIPPARDGYTFTGWDKAFDSVTSNLAVTALYEASSPILSHNIAKGSLITPTQNGITLTAKTSATVAVYNLSGRLISRQSYNAGNHSISFGHLPKGVYVVKALHGGEKEILRLAVR
jgi:uncharacterized repeat protein (TIGR02543 family)